MRACEPEQEWPRRGARRWLAARGRGRAELAPTTAVSRDCCGSTFVARSSNCKQQALCWSGSAVGGRLFSKCCLGNNLLVLHIRIVPEACMAGPMWPQQRQAVRVGGMLLSAEGLGRLEANVCAVVVTGPRQRAGCVRGLHASRQPSAGQPFFSRSTRPTFLHIATSSRLSVAHWQHVIEGRVSEEVPEQTQ